MPCVRRAAPRRPPARAPRSPPDRLRTRRRGRLLQGQPVGVHPGLGGGAAGDGQDGVDGGPGDGGALDDLSGGHAEQGELLDRVPFLGLPHRGAVDVLDELVDDPVGLFRTLDDVHRDEPVVGADLRGGEGAPLAPVDHEIAAVVGPHGDGLQHAACLDRGGELARAGVGVGADVRADGQGLRPDPVGLPDPVSGGGVVRAHVVQLLCWTTELDTSMVVALEVDRVCFSQVCGWPQTEAVSVDDGGGVVRPKGVVSVAAFDLLALGVVVVGRRRAVGMGGATTRPARGARRCRPSCRARATRCAGRRQRMTTASNGGTVICGPNVGALVERHGLGGASLAHSPGSGRWAYCDSLGQTSNVPKSPRRSRSVRDALKRPTSPLHRRGSGDMDHLEVLVLAGEALAVAVTFAVTGARTDLALRTGLVHKGHLLGWFSGRRPDATR